MSRRCRLQRVSGPRRGACWERDSSPLVVAMKPAGGGTVGCWLQRSDLPHRTRAEREAMRDAGGRADRREAGPVALHEGRKGQLGNSAAGTGGIALHQVSESAVAAIDSRLASNAAAVVFRDFIAAVDVGMRPFASRMFRTALEETYQRPVKFVCVTHYHADHTFGLSPFRDCTLVASAAITAALEQSSDWSAEGQARWRESEPEGAAWLEEVERIWPSFLLEGRLQLADGDKRLELYSSGGHTQCSLYGYLPEERVLLAGDLIFADQVPFAGDDTADPETWISVLSGWLNLAVDWVIPGHGPVSTGAEIRRQLAFLEELRDATLTTLAENGRPEDIPLPSTYPEVREPWFVEKTLKRWHSYYRARLLAS